MTVYIRLKTTFEERQYKVNEVVIEAVVLEYTRRLSDYDKVISQLRAKVDIMDMRTQPSSQFRNVHRHRATSRSVRERACNNHVACHD